MERRSCRNCVDRSMGKQGHKEMGRQEWLKKTRVAEEDKSG
jgi:hypothetical protein